MPASRLNAAAKLGFSVLVAASVFGLAFLVQGEVGAAQQSNFMGGMISLEDSEDVRTIRILFPAGVRSNWHTHTDGQLLMIEEGRGRTQVRGEPLQVMHPGVPWWTDAGVEHWHGADLDVDAVQLTIYEGTVEWLEPVVDDVYRADPGR